MASSIGFVGHRPGPASTWTMALLLLGGAARCAVATNRADGSTARLLAGVAVACLILGVAILVARMAFRRAAVHALLLVVVLVTTVLVAVSDTRGDAVLSAFGYAWIGLYAAHFLSPRIAHCYAALVSGCFAGGLAIAGSTRMLGTWLVVSLTVFAVTTVISALVASLRAQSETDVLTSAVNRAGFQRLADRELARSARTGRPVSVVLCDVDGLKAVNDSYGHAAGDAMLVRICAAWGRELRAGDVLARIGGDEFAVLLTETDAASAHVVVERLRAATDAPFSAGVATWRGGSDSTAQLLSRADAAMYACKGASRRLRPVSPRGVGARRSDPCPAGG